MNALLFIGLCLAARIDSPEVDFATIQSTVEWPAIQEIGPPLTEKNLDSNLDREGVQVREAAPITPHNKLLDTWLSRSAGDEGGSSIL